MKNCRLFILLTLSLTLLAAGCGTSPSQQQAQLPEPEPEIENLPPVIAGLNAAAQTEPNSQLEISCQATDPEGSPLNYFWEVTGGKIDGTGSTATWTAPQPAGDYFIKVSVSDNTGMTASKQLSINVPERPNHPPVIKAFVFTRQDHLPITVKMNATEQERAKIPDLIIKRYETAELSCVAEDPDGDKIEYIWLTSGGKIRESGSMVYWITPGEAGDYTITMEISDGRGGTASYTAKVTVKCCGI